MELVIILKKAVKRVIAAAEWILKHFFLTIVVLIFMFAMYVELDTYQTVSEADSSQYKPYKPVSDNTLSFEQMQSFNSDIIGWLTINDTTIDYPIVQGKTNETYINTSVFGEFSLTGSIFLDFRNKADFTDTLSIIYGHNMIGNVMFGGIDLFKDSEYFDSHRTGTLYCSGNYYDINIFACFRANGYDMKVYQPQLKRENVGEWLEYIRESAIQTVSDIPENMPILVMSTCSSESTDARTLLAATFSKGEPPVQTAENTDNGFWIHIPSVRIDTWNGYHLAIGILIWLIVTVIFTLLKRKKKKKGNQNGSQKKEP